MMLVCIGGFSYAWFGESYNQLSQLFFVVFICLRGDLDLEEELYGGNNLSNLSSVLQ